MSGRFIVRPRADRDLDELLGYLAERNSQAARRFYAAAQTTFQLLAEMPELGGVWESSQVLATEIRVWPVRRFRKYLIFYRPIADGIEVIRVLHGARDLDNIFGSTDQ